MIDVDVMEAVAPIDEALQIAIGHGPIKSAHQGARVIDQMVRALTGPDYAEFVRMAEAGVIGPSRGSWDEGRAA